MCSHRTLVQVKLWDAGPVTYPQYTETVVDARSHEAWQKSQEPPPEKPPEEPPAEWVPSEETRERERRQKLAELD